MKDIDLNCEEKNGDHGNLARDQKPILLLRLSRQSKPARRSKAGVQQHRNKAEEEQPTEKSNFEKRVQVLVVNARKLRPRNVGVLANHRLVPDPDALLPV